MKHRAYTAISIVALIAAILLIVSVLAAGVAEPALIPDTAGTAAETTHPAYTIDLTRLIIAVIGLVMSYLTAWIAKNIVPPVRSWLQAHTTHEQRETLARITTEAVKAAEQLIGAGRGADKLDYVIHSIEAHGFTADRATIEAAVKDMNDFRIADLFADPASPEPVSTDPAGEAAEPLYHEDEKADSGLLYE